MSAAGVGGGGGTKGQEGLMNNLLTFPRCVWVSLSLFTVNRRVIFHPSKWNQGYVSIETSPARGTPAPRGPTEGAQERRCPLVDS